MTSMAKQVLKSAKQIRTRKPQKSGGKGWLVALLLIALGGGGYYGYDMYQKKENERKAQEAARLARIAADKKLAEEMARLAAEKEEQDRLAAEEEARRKAAEEEEARRKAEEERLRKLREAQDKPDTPAKDVEEPDKTDSTPSQKVSEYDKEVPMYGANATGASARKQFDELVDKLLEKKDFDAFEKAMSAKIKESIVNYTGSGKLNYAQYKNNRNLIQAVDLCLLIRTAGADALKGLAETEGDENDNNGTDFIRWALRDKSQPLHLFLQNYQTQEGRDENVAHSIRQFYTIWAEMEEKDREKYLNLSIAGALINPQAAEAAGGYRGDEPRLTVPEVCAYMREMDKKRKLVTDIKKLSVSQLLFVVDVRLPQSEIDWAAENVNYAQSDWSNAYNSIKYVMERAAVGKDLYELYTFEEIRKEGGVCRDQGYFSCNTGKCRGVPAVYIVGDGDRGPHAWMVNLVDNVKWVQTNSYGYNSGRFTNPCSGRSQHESTLLSKDVKTTDAKLVPAADAMILANYLSRIGCTKEAHSTARYVTTAFPTLTAAWAHYVKVLGHDENNIPPDKVWRKIDTDLIQLSKKNSELLDIAAEVEDKYLLSGKNAASKQMALRRSMSQLNKRGGDDRADLVLNAVNRQAEVFAETRNLTGLAGLYRKQLKKYTSRGDIFGQLLEQYMNHLGDEAPARAWNVLAKDADKLFEKHVRSNGSDLFKLKKEVAIQNQIATAWEKAGNERKATKMREDAELRMQKAENRYVTDDDDDD